MALRRPRSSPRFEADCVVAELAPGRGVVELTLARADPVRPALPPVDARAHLDLVTSTPLCGSPADPTSYRIAVLRTPDSRGGSAAVHALAEATPCRCAGPRNHFPLVTAPQYLFVAGGIGITPLLPVIEEVDAAGADWRLVYGGRTHRVDGLPRRARPVRRSRGGGAPGRAGTAGHRRPAGHPDPETLLYTCGPEPLLR
ncbi:MAG: hypothetical protein R2731_05500 [Nocardioides sp.]